MKEVSFESDYIAGAHPEILKALVDTNLECLSGYGTDRYCDSAKEKIKKACNCPEAEVEFLVGGTQTNSIIISTMLKGYEGVIAAKTGHISLHEAGAVEYSGIKVLEIEGKDGKLDAKNVKKYIEDFYDDGSFEHMVFPGMVYISQPTEYGTLYTKEELEALSKVCKEYKIPLFADGARLIYALSSKESDVTLEDMARLTDVFYIGGTKAGCLCGEAVVFTKNNRPKHFINLVKKRGGLLAKGRLLGVQFDALFTNDTYKKIGDYAIDMASKLIDIIEKSGKEFYLKSPTNQQFIIFENKELKAFMEKVKVSFWEKYDETHTVVRLATSWSTSEKDLEILEKEL
ncbi:L-threonine aldolase [Acetitomaculum ruminis DSM 5522]|uniref:L-threonine aldolase n=1 Tax=Acetitomaculum ruminis DSM 5522 TaxID=1120918 RepID=A0A1I1AI91_9FIRM|nr:aminotransferase class I/II-fold pyridoxal phosphate-dependent enzyme [Acetitomaculum ruminis]SFB37667.1 L-threonine aldolase [Acetitomaculum ruminis DSM 5522]